MPKVVFLITKGLLLFYGFGWVVGWVGSILGPHFHYGMGWVALDRSFGGLGCVGSKKLDPRTTLRH